MGEESANKVETKLDEERMEWLFLRVNERHDKCFLPVIGPVTLTDSVIVTVGVCVLDLEAQALVDLQGAFIST